MILKNKVALAVELSIYTYDTDHGYRKQMVRENVRFVSVSCQFTFKYVDSTFIKMVKM